MVTDDWFRENARSSRISDVEPPKVNGQPEILLVSSRMHGLSTFYNDVSPRNRTQKFIPHCRFVPGSVPDVSYAEFCFHFTRAALQGSLRAFEIGVGSRTSRQCGTPSMNGVVTFPRRIPAKLFSTLHVKEVDFMVTIPETDEIMLRKIRLIFEFY